MVDTHAWLWWVTRHPALSKPAGRAIESADMIGVATISTMEVAALVRQEKISIDIEARPWVAQALALDRVIELPLSTEIAIEAGSFGDDFVGDPADRIIYATAIATGSRLVTRDRFLRSYDPLRTVW